MSKPTFDIRKYMDVKESGNERRQREYDRLNLFFSLIYDIPFNTLLTTRVSELCNMLEKNMQRQQTTDLKWKNVPTILKAGRDLAKVSGDRTVAEIFATRKKEAPKIDHAVKKLRRLGIFMPPLQESDDLREQYFRKVVTNRVIRVIGNLTPRDMFEKRKRDLSKLQRAVILEAKMINLMGGSDCGDPLPKLNNRICQDIEGVPGGQCVPHDGAQCVVAGMGDYCNPATDSFSDGEEPPQMEPSPGSSGNP